MHIDREPHIGEYEAKTNAICDFSQIQTASERGPASACGGDGRGRGPTYWPWLFST